MRRSEIQHYGAPALLHPLHEGAEQGGIEQCSFGSLACGPGVPVRARHVSAPGSRCPRHDLRHAPARGASSAPFLGDDTGVSPLALEADEEPAPAEDRADGFSAAGSTSISMT